MKTELEHIMLEQIKLEFNERIDALLKKYVEPPKTGFKVGSYVFNHLGAIARVIGFREGDGNLKSLRIGHNDTELYPCYSLIKSCRPATESEVKEALIKEAEKRGFKEGVKWIHDGSTNDISNSNDWYYCSREDALYGMPKHKGGVRIYKQGKWATIVKEEAIKIGGYEVRYNAGNGGTTIDGHNFTKEFWEAAKIVAEHSKSAVWVGCDSKNPCGASSNKWPVSRETINKILNKLK